MIDRGPYADLTLIRGPECMIETTSIGECRGLIQIGAQERIIKSEQIERWAPQPGASIHASN